MPRKLIAILLAVGAYNLFFFSSGLPSFGSLGFTLLILLIQAFLWLAFYSKTFSEKEEQALVASSISILASVIGVFRASSVDAALLGFLSLGLSLVSLYLLALTHSEFGSIAEILFIPLGVAKHWFSKAVNLIDSTPEIISKFQTRNRALKLNLSFEKSTTTGLIRGIIITIPVVLVILMALSSADPIFSKLLSENFKKILDFLSPFLEIKLAQRLIVSLFIVILTAPVAFMTIGRRFRSPLVHARYRKFRIEAAMLVSAVALVLASFLIIQFRYLFATVQETELNQFGVQTYSEYVRRGFLELTFVSIVVYLTAGAGLVVLRASPPKKRDLVQTANLVLFSETVIFIISILRRVFLYQIHHGLTRVRIYGTAFLLLLIALTCVLILRQVKGAKHKFYRFESLIVIASIILVTLVDPDKLIATRFKPSVNREIDYVYISRLSPSAVEGWLEAYQQANILAYKLKTKDPKLIPEDETRRLIYASRSINLIRVRYIFLIRKYGTAEEFSQIALRDEGKHTLKPKAPTPKLKHNLAELEAYQKLKSTIAPNEINQLSQDLSQLLLNIPQERQPVALDRSTLSPLVK